MGVKKSKNRIELEKHDIQALLKNNKASRLARFFKVSETTFSRAAYAQLKEKMEKKRANVDAYFFEESKQEVEFLGTKGAWAELKSTQLYKQIMYGNENTL